jgi:hypothetical protein
MRAFAHSNLKVRIRIDGRPRSVSAQPWSRPWWTDAADYGHILYVDLYMLIPDARVVRDAQLRPLLERRDQSVLREILGPDQRRTRSARDQR